MFLLLFDTKDKIEQINVWKIEGLKAGNEGGQPQRGVKSKPACKWEKNEDSMSEAIVNDS